MPLRIDPERNEIRALRDLGNWRGQRVLEVGCGDGRLSRRLAGLGAAVVAIDPDRELIAAARAGAPPRLAPRLHFEVGSAGRLEQPAQSFDRVVFAWVL
jgi:2-polyprenyl-3-methyl-5-hydroxy-6-metoxy-1,4-benzoquinol methylase